MKQQVSLPGFAVPSHTPSASATEREAALAASTAPVPDSEQAPKSGAELIPELATGMPLQPVQQETHDNTHVTAAPDLPQTDTETA